MIRLPKHVVVGVGLAVLIIVAFPLITNHPGPPMTLAGAGRPLTTKGGAVQATYYCPMHPTYTSDRPGDCPICNMKLVKREDQPPAGQARAQQPQSAKDICYMHTCPMMKPGQKLSLIHI